MTGRPLGSGSLKKVRNGRGQLVFRGTWTGADGKTHRKLMSSDKRVAERMLAAIIRDRDLAIQGLGVEAGQDRLLNAVIEDYLRDLRARRSPRYALRCERVLAMMLEAIGDTRIKRISRQQVSIHRSRRSEGGASNRTCNLEVGALKTCLNWAVEQGLIGANPLLGLKALPQGEAHRTRKRHAMTDNQIAQFRRGAQLEDEHQESIARAEKTVAGGTKGPGYAKRKRRVRVPQTPLWETILQTALRYTEAITLTWADLDGDNLVLRVRAENSKSHRSREIPIQAELLERLLALKPLHALAAGRMPKPSDRVFLTSRGKHYVEFDSANALRVFYRVLKEAKLPRKTDLGRSIDLHSLRTTCGSRWAREGVPPQVLQVLMGHSNIAITMEYYVFLRTEDTRLALQQVPKLPTAEAPDEGQDAGVSCTYPAIDPGDAEQASEVHDGNPLLKRSLGW